MLIDWFEEMIRNWLQLVCTSFRIKWVNSGFILSRFSSMYRYPGDHLLLIFIVLLLVMLSACPSNSLLGIQYVNYRAGQEGNSI